jgi:hypothetical protein
LIQNTILLTLRPLLIVIVGLKKKFADMLVRAAIPYNLVQAKMMLDDVEDIKEKDQLQKIISAYETLTYISDAKMVAVDRAMLQYEIASFEMCLYKEFKRRHSDSIISLSSIVNFVNSMDDSYFKIIAQLDLVRHCDSLDVVQFDASLANKVRSNAGCLNIDQNRMNRDILEYERMHALSEAIKIKDFSAAKRIAASAPRARNLSRSLDRVQLEVEIIICESLLDPQSAKESVEIFENEAIKTSVLLEIAKAHPNYLPELRIQLDKLRNNDDKWGSPIAPFESAWIEIEAKNDAFNAIELIEKAFRDFGDSTIEALTTIVKIQALNHLSDAINTANRIILNQKKLYEHLIRDVGPEQELLWGEEFNRIVDNSEARLEIIKVLLSKKSNDRTFDFEFFKFDEP